MNRNNFSNAKVVIPARIWVAPGELWLGGSDATIDGVFIDSRNDEGATERYLVYFIQDIKKRVEVEGEKIRGMRFMGVSANGMYDPNWQNLNMSELDRFTSLMGRFNYVTKGSANLNKNTITLTYKNHGIVDRAKISFT